MADSVFDEMMGDNDKGQSLKASEITGDRFPFHSLPKEFQDWHTNYFIMEQRAPLDSNIVSKAVLNGYMWKVIYDGSIFGLSTSIFIIFSVIKLKLAPNMWGLFISLLIYLPWLAYAIYHFKFYAYIRAQVVGPVTKNAKETIVDFFLSTYVMTIAAILIAFTVVLSFLHDIADLLAKLVNEMDANPDGLNATLTGPVKSAFISIHNNIAVLLNEPEDTFGQLLFNEYLTTGFLLALSIWAIYYFEKNWYDTHKEGVDLDVKKAKVQSGYPIEAALDCLWEWRKRNGV